MLDLAPPIRNHDARRRQARHHVGRDDSNGVRLIELVSARLQLHREVVSALDILGLEQREQELTPLPQIPVPNASAVHVRDVEMRDESESSFRS